MPNRIIKESICTSEDIAKLSIEAEVLFYRLIVNADDYGCYFGNPSLVKSRCFPLKSDDIHSEQVDTWLEELAKAGLIIRYTAADERDYCQFVKWNKHQRVRQSEHKYPQYDASCCELKSSCGNPPRVAANVGKMPPNPIQSNPIQNPIQSESNDDDGFEKFWAAYPKKSGDIRQACMEYMGAIQDGVTPDEILDAVKTQAEAKEQRYFPSAEKWLRNKGWTEKIKETEKKKSPAYMSSGPQQPLSSDDWDKILDAI